MTKKKDSTTTPDPKPEKDAQKSALVKNLVGSTLLVALGMLLLLRPDFATTTVASVLGWILIGGGAILIAVTILNWDTMGIPELIVGIVAAAVGIFVVIRPELLASAFGIIIAIYLGFEGVRTVIAALKLQKSGKAYLPRLILGLVQIALALGLGFTRMHIYWLLRAIGVLMALSGLTNLVLSSRYFTNLPQKKAQADSQKDA
jgi:uncharacterized membrane protein HdeD (DUF308 family)